MPKNRKLTEAQTMMFPSWADYLCGHKGADKTNKCSSDLGEQFRCKSIPLEQGLKGEQAILFMGITSDGSLLFLHHITDLGSTRRDPYINRRPGRVPEVDDSGRDYLQRLLRKCAEQG
jgi:hypothetical protein